MAAAGKTGFRDFVVARRHRLLRTAYLLAGDQDRAARLLRAALLRTRRNWRRLVWGDDPEWFALRSLAALHASRRREWGARAAEIAGRVAARLARHRHGSGSGRGSGSVEAPAAAGTRDGFGTDAESTAEDPDARVREVLWSGLGALRPRARAALVLRYYEELAEDDAAEVLACSLAALRAEERRGLELSRAVLAHRPEGGAGAESDPPGTAAAEAELREVLAAQAAALPPENDPYERTARGIRQLRLRRLGAAAICLCVLAAVAVPVAVFRPFRDVPLEGWYVRGSLADDSSFVEAARAKAVDKAELKSSQEVEYSRVVYAGDKGAYRRVVAVLSLAPLGQGPESTRSPEAGGETILGGPRTMLVLLRGEFGSAVEDLEYQPTGVFLSGEVHPMGAAQPDVPSFALLEERPSGGWALFVLGPPDTQTVSYSPRPRFHPDGTWSRSWTTVPVDDGVAFRELPGGRNSASMVRLRLPDTAAAVRAFSLSSGGSEYSLPDVEGVSPESRSTGVTNGLLTLMSQTGVPANRFDVRSVWHNQGEHWRSGESWLLAAELPNGATFQILSTSTTSYVRLVPRRHSDRPLAVATYALSFRAEGPERAGADGPGRPSVLVVAPDHSGHDAQLLADGEELSTQRIDDAGSVAFGGANSERGGKITAAAQEGNDLTVRIVDAGGAELHRGDVQPPFAQPWNRPGDTRGRRGG